MFCGSSIAGVIEIYLGIIQQHRDNAVGGGLLDVRDGLKFSRSEESRDGPISPQRKRMVCGSLHNSIRSWEFERVDVICGCRNWPYTTIRLPQPRPGYSPTAFVPCCFNRKCWLGVCPALSDIRPRHWELDDLITEVSSCGEVSVMLEFRSPRRKNWCFESARESPH